LIVSPTCSGGDIVFRAAATGNGVVSAMGAVLGPFRVRKLPVCIVVQNTLWLVVLAAGGSTAVKTVWLCSGRLVVLTAMGKGCSTAVTVVGLAGR